MRSKNATFQPTRCRQAVQSTPLANNGASIVINIGALTL
jgi:hypothetical protein